MPRKPRKEVAISVDHVSCADMVSSQLSADREPVAESAGRPRAANAASASLPHSPRPHGADPQIQRIMKLARERSYWMQMRLRNTARLAAMVRSMLQPTRGQEDTWSEETKTQALEIVKEAVDREIRVCENARRALVDMKLLKIAPPDPTAHPLLSESFVIITARSLAEWELTERDTLAKMERIVSTFPIAAFVDSPHRKGFTLAGLAVIIGHAGHPLNYPKKGHLWKRLGLAPFSKDGVTRAGSSWGRYGGLSKEDWIELGYKRSRLGDIFGKITQPLLYAQWRATGAIGPYGEAYGRYKARQIELNEAGTFAEEAARQAASAKKNGIKPRKELLEGKLTPAAINARALRYMTKKLIADLWFAWRRLEQAHPGDKPTDIVSAAAKPIEGKATVSVHDDARSYLPPLKPHD